MLKIKTNLEEAKAVIIAADNGKSNTVEFHGTGGDQILLTAKVVEAFGETISKEVGMDPEDAIKAICETAILGLELDRGKSKRRDFDDEGNEIKPEEKKVEDPEDALLGRLEKMLDRLENLKKKEC